MDNILEVKNLSVSFSGGVQAVSNVSFSVARGEAFALVGESGCGKSTTARAVMRLIRAPGRITGGEVRFEGRDLLALGEKEMTEVRGKNIGMIFQNPLDSLNPVYTAGAQIAEGLIVDRMEKRAAWKLAADMLRDVKIPDADRRMKSYPHEISGGMRQRVMIGMMLCRRPKLLVLDEPTSALDVSVQAQTLNELLSLQEKFGLAYLFITHNLSVVRYMSDRICVMYGGKVMETGDAEAVYGHCAHPYTISLLSSVPPLHPRERGRKKYLLSGDMPSLSGELRGCRFASRCPFARDACRETEPALRDMGDGRAAACLFAGALENADA